MVKVLPSYFLAALDPARGVVDPVVEGDARCELDAHDGVVGAGVAARRFQFEPARLAAAREPPRVRLASQMQLRIAGRAVLFFQPAHALAPEAPAVRARHQARHRRRGQALRVAAAGEVEVAAAGLVVVEVGAHELGVLGLDLAPGVAADGGAGLGEQRRRALGGNAVKGGDGEADAGGDADDADKLAN